MPRYKFQCLLCSTETFEQRPMNKSDMEEVKPGRWRKIPGQEYTPYTTACPSCKSTAIEADYTEAAPVYFNWFAD